MENISKITDYHNSARESLKNEMPLNIPDICQEEINKLNYQILQVEARGNLKVSKALKEEKAKWEFYQRRFKKLLS